MEARNAWQEVEGAYDGEREGLDQSLLWVGGFLFFAGPEAQFLRELKQKKECITLEN